MPRHVTLQTLADALGVSKMTVSNAFSRPDQLSATLRDRVLQAAAAAGYAGPHPAARALSGGRSHTIGVILRGSLRNALTDYVPAGLVGAVADEFGASGSAITLLSGASADADSVVEHLALDGALVCSERAAGLPWLTKRRVPLVYVDLDPDETMSSVNLDERAGARLGVQHLADLGHREIAICTVGDGVGQSVVRDGSRPVRTPSNFVAAERLRHWRAALRQAGVKPLIGQTSDDAYALARAVLRSMPRPTAVLCYSDRIASEVMAAAVDLGLSVPDDLSVVGFDDSPIATAVRPGLTTVRQDAFAKGLAAARELKRVIDAGRSGEPFTPTHATLPVRLVVRESTAPPP